MKNVRKFLELSTGHLPKETAERIEAGIFQKPPTYANEYGWCFHVPEKTSEVDECPHLMAIVAFAIDAGCDYIIFDRDVAPCDWLPYFDW